MNYFLKVYKGKNELDLLLGSLIGRKMMQLIIFQPHSHQSQLLQNPFSLGVHCAPYNTYVEIRDMRAEVENAT